MAKLHVIHTGFFKLDGGAMFGVVPKQLWQKTNPADDNNLCSWAMRCLLIEEGNRLILVDNGIGNKQDAKFLSHYHLHGNEGLLQNLKKAGFSPNDLTDNILTHLHFDHCGGGVLKNNAGIYETLFQNATYWCHSSHWNWAIQPNPREKASFLKENILPIKESGQLSFLDKTDHPFPAIQFLFVDGHTEKQAIPLISYKGRTVAFVADLLPSVGHLPLPYVMAYDTRPLETMKEKEAFLKVAAKEDYVLFFEHDPVHECCTVQETEKGVRVKELFTLADL